MPLTQMQLLAFNAITGFVKDLSNEFKQKQHSLALYDRLIEHMGLSQEVAIRKVVDGFTTYISKNQTAIEQRDAEKLSSDKVVYSEKVFLVLRPLFDEADSETKEAMWKHLLTIYGILYPDSHAKDILRSMKSEVKNPETALISNMVEKIVPHLNPDETNPMQAIMSLMSSGVFTELVGTMQKEMDGGSINMNSLLGTVSTMFSQPDPTARLGTSGSSGTSGKRIEPREEKERGK